MPEAHFRYSLLSRWTSGQFFSAVLKTVLVAIASSLFLVACEQESSPPPVPAAAQDNPAIVINDALQLMGMIDVSRIEFSANGWEACLGQPWNIQEGWARWEISDYHRVIDYSTLSSLQTARRRAGLDAQKLGGCGAQPDAAPQNQQSSVNSDSSWLQQLQVHLTPAGFLTLAQANDALVDRDSSGLHLSFAIEDTGVTYTLKGSFGDDLLLDHVITLVDDSVFGDMPFEVNFSEYRDYSGLLFPARILQLQGGFATLDLDITNAVANTNAATEPKDGGGFGGGQQADLPEYEQIGDGVYALHGGYQSVVMAFADFLVVLDGLQSDARATEIITSAKSLYPNKPIRYVFTTHAHFDHASGLRQFVAEGATIITHMTNVNFFAQALAMPRTLNPEAVDTTGMPVDILGVDDVLAIDDGTQRVEFYKLDGSTHADDAMIAYIPALKTVVEADLLQPWINPVFGGGDHPFLVWFADELARLELDVEQFVPVHRPATPPLMSWGELMEAVGR